MDRFIETYLINPLLKNQSLKSNMDRFIANPRTKMITEGKV